MLALEIPRDRFAALRALAGAVGEWCLGSVTPVAVSGRMMVQDVVVRAARLISLGPMCDLFLCRFRHLRFFNYAWFIPGNCLSDVIEVSIWNSDCN